MGVQTALKQKKSIQDYMKLPEGALYQLINGEIIMSPSPNRVHQKLVGEIFRLIANYLKEHQKGEVYIAPSDVYLDEENVVQPDIYFVAANNLSILTDLGAEGVPNLIIELLSPSNAYYDLKAKYQLYEKHGVTEYFIVDPEDNMVIAYALVNGRYKELYRELGVIDSMVLGTKVVW